MSTQNTNRRLRPIVLTEDQSSFGGVQTLPTYSPARYEASMENLQETFDDMLRLQELEAKSKADAQAASEAARNAEWKFHNAVLAMKECVVAQFGPDSNAAQAVGLKKKSAYKRPTRRKKDESSEAEE